MAASVRSAVEQADDPSRAVRVVDREVVLEAGADDDRVVRALAREAATASRLRSEPSTTSSHDAAAVTIARVPFVVERISVSARGSRNSRGEAPASKPVDPLRVALAARDRGVAELLPQRPRVVDLRAAEDALVAGRERLDDRRRRAHQVDDDARAAPWLPRPA